MVKGVIEKEQIESSEILRKVFNIFLWIILLAAIAFLCFYLYQNFPRAAETLNLKIGNLGLAGEKQINASSRLEQFVPNMRFNHNALTYAIESNCDNEKTQRFQQALQIIQEQVGVISFSQISDTEKSDIDLSCSKEKLETEKNVFIAGEGGPTKYLNLSWYPVILKGQVILYEKSTCDYPITELHELFHVFGFDHINNKSFIMYPYVDCKEIINPELISKMKEIYSITPLAEVYFTNATVIKTGTYLNFTARMRNEGLMDANKVYLEVLETNGKLIKSFDLGKIEFGSSQQFSVSNLKLPSVSTRSIELSIVTNQKEYDEANNILVFGI